MDTAEQVLNLFDSYWFEHQIITKQPPPPPGKTPVPEIQEVGLKPVICRVPSSRHVRSVSDHLSNETVFTSGSPSPKSVLSSHKLQTIHSGKEVIESPMKVEEEDIRMEKPAVISPRKQQITRRRKKRGSSKSLSDLEFEELKGFMDLGFVFSEEDKNSDLASIIPGLQRLKKKDDENQEVEQEENVISRPYLSEAWEVMERKRKQENANSLRMMNWRIPALLSSEMDMKDHLKNWAHTVASTAAASTVR